MRVLAVDPGSIAMAAVLFVDGRPKFATLSEAKPKDEWHSRVSRMAAELEEVLGGRVTRLDLIAIEQVVVWQNSRAAVTMAMTVGYLIRTLEISYPQAFFVEVPKANICRALGLKGNAKRKERQQAARAKFPGWKQQDVCDAAAVGLAALAMMETKE